MIIYPNQSQSLNIINQWIKQQQVDQYNLQIIEVNEYIPPAPNRHWSPTANCNFNNYMIKGSNLKQITPINQHTGELGYYVMNTTVNDCYIYRINTCQIDFLQSYNWLTVHVDQMLIDGKLVHNVCKIIITSWFLTLKTTGAGKTSSQILKEQVDLAHLNEMANHNKYQSSN